MNEPNAPRLFVEADLPGPVPLDAKAANYLRNVMRLGPGAPLKLFNGRDGEFLATIQALGKRDGQAVAEERLRPQTPKPTLTLAFAPLKQARLDYMAEKAAEMGAGRVVPVLTQHGQVRKVNVARLTANMIEACEQCGTLTVPEMTEPMPLTDFLADPGGTLVVADESIAGAAESAVEAIARVAPPIALLVGPEGGFSDRERALFAGRAVRVSLGPRILRADTAAVALMALAEAAHPSVV